MPIAKDQLKYAGEFGAQFWFTESSVFFPGGIPAATSSVVPAATVRRGIPLFFAIFVVNPKVRIKYVGDSLKPKRDSEIDYDIEVLTPDGASRPGCGGKNLTGWRKTPPAKDVLQVLYGQPGVTFDLIDPLGEYTVNIIVHDRISGIDLPLQQKVVLIED